MSWQNVTDALYFATEVQLTVPVTVGEPWAEVRVSVVGQSCIIEATLPPFDQSHGVRSLRWRIATVPMAQEEVPVSNPCQIIERATGVADVHNWQMGEHLTWQHWELPLLWFCLLLCYQCPSDDSGGYDSSLQLAETQYRLPEYCLTLKLFDLLHLEWNVKGHAS